MLIIYGVHKGFIIYGVHKGFKELMLIIYGVHKGFIIYGVHKGFIIYVVHNCLYTSILTCMLFITAYIQVY